MLSSTLENINEYIVIILVLPIILNEVFMGLLLILKGFSENQTDKK